MHPFHRTELLVGGPAMVRLQESRALVVGLGGVGSYAAEALVRSGIGHVTLVDFDRVCLTNVNRQLHATRKTIGQPKAELMGERARAINPKAEIVVHPSFYTAEREDEILSPGYDVVLDCIDNMTHKTHLLASCARRGLTVFTSAGAGGRLDPTRLRVDRLCDVKGDPFARIVRKRLRADGVEPTMPCVWSDEPPNDLDQAAQAGFRCICPDKDAKEVNSCESRFQIQGSVSFIPSMFGLMMAGIAVNHLAGRDPVGLWS